MLDKIALGFAAVGALFGVGVVVVRFVTTGQRFDGRPVGIGGTIPPAIFFGFAGALVLFAVGSVVAKVFRPNGVKGESAKYEYSSVKDLLARGWTSSNL